MQLLRWRLCLLPLLGPSGCSDLVPSPPQGSWGQQQLGAGDFSSSDVLSKLFREVPTFPASLSQIPCLMLQPRACSNSVFQEKSCHPVSLIFFFSPFPWNDTIPPHPVSIFACQIPALLQDFSIGFSPKWINCPQALGSSTLERIPKFPRCSGFVPAFQFSLPSPFIRYSPPEISFSSARISWAPNACPAQYWRIMELVTHGPLPTKY